MHLSWEALVPDFSIPWPGISTRVASMPSRPSGRRGSWSQGLSTGSDSLMWPLSASPFNFERDVKESRTCRQTCQNAQLSIVSSILKCTREHPNLRPDWFQLPCFFFEQPRLPGPNLMTSSQLRQLRSKNPRSWKKRSTSCDSWSAHEEDVANG